MAAAAIRIYGDLRSQPVRSVVDFCKLAAVPFQLKILDFTQGDHKKPEYLEMFPFGVMPCLQDLREENKGFILGESNAIMRYVCATFEVPSHFYPPDPKTRAIIDQYLDGHHTKIRLITKVTLPFIFLPYLLGAEAAKARQNPKQLDENQKIVEKSFKELNDFYLGNEARLAQAKERGLTNWIATVDEKPSIADLRAFQDISQLEVYPKWMDKLMVDNPRVKAWYDKLAQYPQIQDTQKPYIDFIQDIWKKSFPPDSSL